MKKYFKYSVLLVSLITALSCNPQEHYRILSFFFDGVPRPEPVKKVESDTLSAEKQEKLPLISGSKMANTRNQPVTKTPLSFHPDYRKKACEKCHEISHAYRIKQRQPELCYQCHKPFESQYARLHGPVAAGFCNACHTVHQSEYKALLKMPVRSNCQHCHEPGDVNKNEAHKSISERSCLDCHNAHGGNTVHFLK